MKVTFEIPEKEDIKFCRLCGKPFDKEEYKKTMLSQCKERPDAYKWFGSARYCGLFCSWLSDPGMCSTIKRLQRTKSLSVKKHHMEYMKNDIAKRVAKYLAKEIKTKDRDYPMKKGSRPMYATLGIGGGIYAFSSSGYMAKKIRDNCYNIGKHKVKRYLVSFREVK